MPPKTHSLLVFSWRFPLPSFWLTCLLFLGINAPAQPIRFFEGSFEALKKEAKQTQKYIFIDFYTDWCKPCLMMQQHTFVEDTLGKFMNTFYLSYKVNCEKDTFLKRQFNVPTYPYWVFLSPDAEIKYAYTGFVDAEFMLNRAKETINFHPEKYQYHLYPQSPEKLKKYLALFAKVYPDSAARETERFLHRFPPQEWVKTPLWEIVTTYIHSSESPIFQMLMLKVSSLLPIQAEISSFALRIMGEEHILAFKTRNHETVKEYEKKYLSVLKALNLLKLPEQAYIDELEAEFAMLTKEESLFLAISQSLLQEYYPLSAEKYADYSIMAIQAFSGENSFQLALEWAKKAESLEPLSMKPQYAMAYYRYRKKDYANALRYIEKAKIYALDTSQKNMVDELEKKIKSRIK